MDNHPHDEIPPVNLPRPTAERLPAPNEAPLNRPVGEAESARAVELNIPSMPTPLPPVPAGDNQVPVPQTPLPPVLPEMPEPDYGTSLGGTPPIADDTDLIEKEWVEKAKEIVARTRDDPYKQNKEMNKMKADYLKKRYNKDLKVEND